MIPKFDNFKGEKILRSLYLTITDLVNVWYNVYIVYETFPESIYFQSLNLFQVFLTLFQEPSLKNWDISKLHNTEVLSRKEGSFYLILPKNRYWDSGRTIHILSRKWSHKVLQKLWKLRKEKSQKGEKKWLNGFPVMYIPVMIKN